jgi:CheY-like chemotaxis protein
MITKVVLIDDNENANFYTQRIIERTQLVKEVIPFEKAKEALDYLTTKNDEGKYPEPKMIFLDINMPEMDGWEFLEQYDTTLGTQKLKTNIIMLTSSDYQDDRDRAARFDVVSNYICKPLYPHTLNEILKFHQEI